VPWAAISIAVYPFGINLTYFGVLYYYREAIKNEEADDIAFLHYAYRRDAWYWEPVDSLRRISLTGLLVWFSDENRVVAAMLLSFFWLLMYYRFSPFARRDDQALAEIVNAEIVFTTMLLSCSRVSLLDSNVVGICCVCVNLLIIPFAMGFQLRHTIRGWRTVRSLEPGRQPSQSFSEDWFKLCWAAGGGARDLIRGRLLNWLEHALPSADDDATFQSILHILQLPPLQNTMLFTDPGMGIVLEYEDGVPAFAVLESHPVSIEESRRATHGRYVSSMTSTTSGGHALLSNIDVQQQVVTAPFNARLRILDAASPNIDVRHTPNEFSIELQSGRRVPFETILLHTWQKLVERGLAHRLLELRSEEDSSHDFWYPAHFPLHFVLQSQVMTSQLLATLIVEVGAKKATLEPDESGNYPLHFLKYRRTSSRGEVVARSEDAISDLIVGAAKAEPSLVQGLLQQAAVHGFMSASQRLIDECGGQADEPCDVDPRATHEIGRDTQGAATRALFHNRDERSSMLCSRRKAVNDHSQSPS